MEERRIIDFENEFAELDELLVINNINLSFDKIIIDSNEGFEKVKKFPELSTVDITVCLISALVSTIIDVVFVGCPDVKKIYKGGENFDGSVFTKLLKNIGKDANGDLCGLLQWFSDKCKVPYDISISKNALTPNNHRLRNFAHDPLFGLLFAVVDIILGTTTCIDNNGLIKIIVNDRKATPQKKLFAVVFYVGHLISDICTVRGLPIPGFFMMEFLVADTEKGGIARIAEDMYKNGYDARHLASMSVPIVVKNMIIDAYLSLQAKSQNVVEPLYQREKALLDEKLKKCKMKLIANSVASTGNLLKLILPPSNGNPCSINIVQWFSLFKSVEGTIKAINRSMEAEQAIHNRSVIDKTWEELIEEL